MLNKCPKQFGQWVNIVITLVTLVTVITLIKLVTVITLVIPVVARYMEDFAIS